MCGLICVPSPRLNRPCDASCRSYAVCASVIGLRANAIDDRGRELDPLGVLGGEQEREETRRAGPSKRVACRRSPRLRCRARDLGNLRADRWWLMPRRRASVTSYDWRDGDYGPETYGERIADVYDEWYKLPDTARRGAHCSPSSRPAAGRSSSGSAPAGSRSRSPRTASRCTASTRRRRWSTRCAPSRAATRSRSTIGDMADVPVDGEFALVFIVFNTFFMLTHAGGAGALLPQRRRAPARRAAASCCTRSCPTCHASKPGQHLGVRRSRRSIACGSTRRPTTGSSSASTRRRSASRRAGHRARSRQAALRVAARARPDGAARGAHARIALGRRSTSAVHRRERVPRFRLSRMI